jgi:hypothetical protein
MRDKASASFVGQKGSDHHNDASVFCGIVFENEITLARVVSSVSSCAFVA